MPFDPIVTELEVEVEEPIDPFPPTGERVYDSDRDIWWTAVGNYSTSPPSVTVYRGPYVGNQAIALPTYQPPGYWSGAYRLLKVGNWIVLTMYGAGMAAAHVSDATFGPVYIQTLGQEPYFSPDEYTYYSDPPLLMPCGTGIAWGYQYLTPNIYDDTVAYPDMTAAAIAVTNDPRTDAGWNIATTLLPREVFPPEDTGAGSGPGRAALFQPVENDDTLIYHGFTIPYTDYGIEVPTHLWSVRYDKSAGTWSKVERSGPEGFLAYRGAGSRWLGYDFETFAAKLSNTSDPDGSYTTLTLPDFSPFYIMEQPVDWPNYIGSNQWLGMVRGPAEEWTDEWGNTNSEDHYRWVVLNLDWSDWEYVDDPLPPRYIGGFGPLTPYETYRNSEGGVVIPLTTYGWRRDPENEYWDTGDSTYWVLSAGAGTTGGTGGWD